VTACGAKQKENAYFHVKDVFTIKVEGVENTVVVGYPEKGSISVGDTLTCEGDGESIQTSVVMFEDLNGNHPDTAKENEQIAIWLDKYLSDKIKADDMLVK